MSTTTNMGLTLPEVGVTTVSTAAADLVTALETVDAHDHSSGSGVKITPEGININADLDLNDNTLKAAHALEVTSLSAAVTGSSNANKLQSVNGELYFTDGTGVAVAITANGGIDTTVSGGWTGDYGSTPAEASYIAASKTFKFMQNGNTNQAGKIDTGDITLRTTTAGAANYVTIKSPVLSSSYSVTLPTAAPGSTSIMSMDSSGVIANTRDPSVSTVTTTGAVTVGGTLGVTGASTLAALSATTGTFSSTLGVTGASTLGVVTGTTFNGVDPSALASRFITGAADEIDGDKLDIDWTPSYYTPATTPTEVSSVDNLTAHLYGIDQQLNTIAGGGGTDHGTLSGLADDDHTQYLLVDGTRAMTGGLNMGTNAITGATSLSLSTTLGVTGASTLAALSATTGTFSSTLGVTGTSTLGVTNTGALGVTGNATISNTVNTNILEVTTTSALDGAVTCGSTLSVTGDISHGDRKLWLHASAFQGAGGASNVPENSNGPRFSTDSYMTIDGGGFYAMVPVPLLEGDRIKSYKLVYYTTTAETWNTYVYSVDDTGTATQESTDSWTAGTGGGQNHEVTSVNQTLAADTMYYIRIRNGNTGGARLYGMQIIYDRV